LRINKLSSVVIIFVFVLAGGKFSVANSTALTVRAGIGYDFVSQQYFIDSVRFSGSDSLTELSLLEKDYLDDKKALLSVSFNPDSKGHYSLEGSWEQTSELFRAGGRGFLSFGDFYNQLQAELNVDIKERYRGDIIEGEEMTILDGTIRLKKQLADNFNGKISLSGESVIYDTVGTYIYNYSRLRSYIELNYITENYNSIYLTFGAEKRYVPDTSHLDYNLFRGGMGYTGSVMDGSTSAEVSFESKDYNQIDDPDDYFLTMLHADLRFSISDRLDLITDFEMEHYNFSEENYINEDYYQTHLGLYTVWEMGDFSFSLGPEIEFLTIDSKSENDDDYFELLGFAGFDYFQGFVFLFLDNQFGHRRYLNNPILYSDFVFDRVSIIGSLSIFWNLNLDVLLSAEWEWHQNESDDSRLYLLSSSLTYSF